MTGAFTHLRCWDTGMRHRNADRLLSFQKILQLDNRAIRRGSLQARASRHLGGRRVAWVGRSRLAQPLCRSWVGPLPPHVPSQAATPVVACDPPPIPLPRFNWKRLEHMTEILRTRATIRPHGRTSGLPSSTRGRSRMDYLPCPDLCGGCAAMRIPTATAGGPVVGAPALEFRQDPYRNTLYEDCRRVSRRAGLHL